ncbi:cyclic nucleotide-binding domain containing protein [Trichomonas vaginalis G3]|uniref:Cyclic nucleotide-binding domain containing protein n=1 Tax=Trichomonas vaginalis (strain ATCC PRA-98 / G3) TaxID=412133 RepID=A2F9K9_TRIV3|nr:cAMP-dependent protein kinase regulator protein [Trichomonas vaginalis G3]EAX98390.1 cyclic nucleotide-binding domain containing protein [Trichomonas vaginalis G3]KAI5486575.1 cAMP-dependent protein kinase regulator protein [Trichomonas vaginalis G3]|eukprot:XP_001311320.1 cyclic nucleotide-binding domain containing protein [Trichomonas vaginalis G3]
MQRNTNLPAEEYLQQNHVTEMLEEMVSDLLVRRPANVREHMIQFLQNYVPPQSRAAMAQPNSARVGFQEKFTPARRFSCISQDALVKSRDFRRRGFSSKSISDTKIEIKTYPKSPEQIQILEGIVKKVSFLSFLQKEQTKALIDAMFPMEFEDGKVIIKQGDRGDNFYVIQSGLVDIFKKVGDQPEKKVAQIGDGAYFGELALMTGAPRAATVIAHGSVKCWAIDQTTYLYLLKDVHYQRRQRCKEIITKVPLLAEIPDYQALLIAESLVSQDIPEKTTIIKQGEQGDKFYVILDGEADVIVNGKTVNHLKAGNYFGELALIYSSARAASVISTTPMSIAYISADIFRKVADKCKSTFHANEMTYKKPE